MNRPYHFRLLMLGTLLSLGGAGCLNLKPTEDPTRYFLLQPSQHPDRDASPGSGPSVGIAPVRIPDYLRRPGMVVRTSETEIRYSDFFRWGEPLDTGIARVLARNLGVLLDTDQVYLNAWPRDEGVVELRLSIDRFDADQDGTVILEARWNIRSAQPMSGHCALRRTGPSPTTDPGSSVAVQSEALMELSRLIAEDLELALPRSD